jgi:hypothetical protein
VKTLAVIIALLNLAVLCACSVNPAASSVSLQKSDPLLSTMAGLDAEVFAAFNRCQEPQQLLAYGGYFAADVEFYHDTGGVTWTRQAMLANTRQYVCGKFQRQLVPDSLKVYPIKDFGALAQGEHLFCKLGEKQCDGTAQFIIIWQLVDNKWQISRVLSYGHRANK